MTAALSEASTKPLGFGFRPEESEHHFVVTIPGSTRKDILVAEHLRYDRDRASTPLGVGVEDARFRATLPREKWDAIADDVRVEFNRRLKKQRLPSGRWKRGDNAVARLLGKELTLLAWAVEDADPALIPTAIKNWLGLAPEERWWLFTMTNAATGHVLHGRNKGWRKAVRFALTENPVIAADRDRQADLFRLVSAEEPNGATHAHRHASGAERPVASED